MSMTGVLDLTRDVTASVETVLGSQLRQERMRTLACEPEREQLDQDYEDFCDWAAEYDLPPGPHTAAAYLLELAFHYRADWNTLRRVAGAMIYRHDRDAYTPIRAALNFCSE